MSGHTHLRAQARTHAPMPALPSLSLTHSPHPHTCARARARSRSPPVAPPLAPARVLTFSPPVTGTYTHARERVRVTGHVGSRLKVARAPTIPQQAKMLTLCILCCSRATQEWWAIAGQTAEAGHVGSWLRAARAPDMPRLTTTDQAVDISSSATSLLHLSNTGVVGCCKADL